MTGEHLGHVYMSPKPVGSTHLRFGDARVVEGGRLGLMPGVLFHSCRPSFRHTGVMFLDFVSLTRLGDLWDPLDSSL